MNYIENIRSFLSTKIDVEDDLLDLYTLLVITSGTKCSLEQVHDAWAVWKNKTNPSHKSIIPFCELTLEVRELDREYAIAIQQTARQICGES